MSELTDDQLDGLFRKSAEEFDPPFDPAAWQDMKSRLDVSDGPTPAGTPIWKTILRWGLPVGVLLLLMMVGSVYTYRRVMGDRDSTSVLAITLPTDSPTAKTRPRGQSPLAEARSTGARPSPTTQTGVSVQSTENDNQAAAVLEKPVTETIRDRPDPDLTHRPLSLRETGAPETIDETRATKGARETYRVKTGPLGAARAGLVRSRAIVPERSGSGIATFGRGSIRTGPPTADRFGRTKKSRSTRMPIAGLLMAPNDVAFSRASSTQNKDGGKYEKSQTSVTNSVGSITETESVKAEAALPLDIKELAIRPANWPKTLPFTGRDVTVQTQPDTISQRVKPASPTERGLSIRFAVAPDLSSVGLKNFARPGTNVGVLLEYRIGPRWSVQTGIIQSTKIYRASKSDYTAPPGSYVDKVGAKLGSIDGQCSMFDIPINLRYDIVLRPRKAGLAPSRWFISSGVTSYYIKQEDYTYNYTGYVHEAVSKWSTKTGGYGLSHLNLSVGYERALTKRLSWQIEPFMKMPLKGVGFFKIDLLSTGTFLSIRYKL